MCVCVCGGFLLEGEGVIVLAGLAVPHQVAGLLTQPEQSLSIGPADRSVVPATERDEGEGKRRRGTDGGFETIGTAGLPVRRQSNDKMEMLTNKASPANKGIGGDTKCESLLGMILAGKRR